MNLENDVKTGLSKIQTLRDEIEVKLHLASLDAKQEWDEKLEPRFHSVAESAKHYTEDAKKAGEDFGTHLSDFVAKLRGKEDEKKA